MLLRIADFLMIGLALGDAAVAGIELGFQYYFIGVGLSSTVYVAIVADVYTKAAVNTGWFWSGRWRAVARAAGV